MLGASTIIPLFTSILKTGHVNKIFHSVIELNLLDGTTKPAAPVDGRFKYVGVDDTKGFTCYCKQISNATVEKTIPINSEKNIYQFAIPYRMVFFNGVEKRSHDDILSKLTQAFLSSKFIRIQKIYTIAADILKMEVPAGKFKFTENTFYCAIDFLLVLQLQAENCEAEISCKGLDNPYGV